MKDMTTVAVKHKTKEKLNRIGQKGQTYDDIIEILCEEYFSNKNKDNKNRI